MSDSVTKALHDMGMSDSILEQKPSGLVIVTNDPQAAEKREYINFLKENLQQLPCSETKH